MDPKKLFNDITNGLTLAANPALWIGGKIVQPREMTEDEKKQYAENQAKKDQDKKDKAAAAAVKKQQQEQKRQEAMKNDPLLNPSDAAKKAAAQVASNPELADYAIPAQNAVRDQKVKQMDVPQVLQEQKKVADHQPSQLDPVTPKEAIQEITGITTPENKQETTEEVQTPEQTQPQLEILPQVQDIKKGSKLWNAVKGYMSTRLGRDVTDDEANAFIVNGLATGIQNAGATLSGSGDFATGDFAQQVKGQNEAQAARRTNEAELEKYGKQLGLSKDQEIELADALSSIDVNKARNLQSALAEGRVKDIQK
ncbi:MAG TPA: hypothetical protein DCO75_00105, partial [Fibrobacteres bacterium]|nr:hypothetical protein [Fibrobacterota bacterium]